MTFYLKLGIFLATVLHAFCMDFSQVNDGQDDILQGWDEEHLRTLNLPEKMKNAIKSDANNRWSEMKTSDNKYIVPYIITGEFSDGEKAIIEGAIKKIEENTCLSFKPRSGEADYVDFINEYDGCFTYLGKIPGRNFINLQNSANMVESCVTHSTVVHEIFHKLGLWHEQQRYDRDDYLTIHYENIPDDIHPQFRKISEAETSVYGVNYDYTSVMHYGKTSGSGNGEITMETKDKKFQDVIGNAESASAGDFTKICSIYNCPTCMGNSTDGKSNDDENATPKPEVTDNSGAKDGSTATNDKNAEDEKPEVTNQGNGCPSPKVPRQSFLCRPGGLLSTKFSSRHYELMCCQIPGGSGETWTPTRRGRGRNVPWAKILDPAV